MAQFDAEVLVGRRYLAKGFLDDALRLFAQHAESVPADDWAALRDRLLERGRIADVVEGTLAEVDGSPARDLEDLVEADADARHRAGRLQPEGVQTA